MSKIAVVFGGQGSQFVGMGETLYSNSDVYKTIVDKCNAFFDEDILSIMQEGPKEVLNQSKNTQLLLTLNSIAIFEMIKDLNLNIECLAGLSLGEYSAFYASNALTLKDVCEITYNRGLFMDKCVKETKGAMAAVLKFDRSIVEEVADSIEGLYVANYNSKVQQVISGTVDAVNKGIEVLKEKGAKRIIVLDVQGAFHTPLLKSASVEFETFLNNITFNECNIPVLVNTTGDYLKGSILDNMVKQMITSVYFEDSIKRLVDDGFDVFIEIGAKSVLGNFIKNVSKDVKIYSVTDYESYITLKENLGG